MRASGEKLLKSGPKLFFAAAAALFLVFIWQRNNGLLGDFFDYSICAAGAGHLHAGLHPYKDFTTPLQSLTLYTCYLAECVFGRNYLALGRGNLFLGLSFYFFILWLMGKKLPFLLATLIAASFCVATFFQHGIIWYNTLAIALISCAIWSAAIMYRERRLSAPFVTLICLSLYLSSMCKFNFHFLGVALVAGILILLAPDLPARSRRNYLWLVPMLLLFSFVLGPATELMLNGASWHQYVENVFKTPSGRFKTFSSVIDPELLLGKLQDFYPDNWISGVYLKGLLLYLGCAYVMIAYPDKAQKGRSWLSPKLAAPAKLGFFLAGSLFLTMTNYETEILTAAFLIVGLSSVYLMFSLQMSRIQIVGFQLCLFTLCAFFMVAAGCSAFMHSRIRYTEKSWCDAALQSFYKHRTYSSIDAALPLWPAGEISPSLLPYFAGVKFTEPAAKRLGRVTAFLQAHHPSKDLADVYWGPGLEILNRAYGESFRGRLPLWYHLNVSVRNADSPRIINELKQGGYEWILASNMIIQIPGSVMDYIDQNYDRIEADEIIVYHRRP